MMHSGKAGQAAFKMIWYGLLACVGLVALGVLAYEIGRIIKDIWPILVVLYMVFVCFVLYFFRDPDPITPSDQNAIVAPGHGKVDVVDETAELEFMGGPCQRVSIFLSVFDVHVQNAPVHGKVVYTQHKPGLIMNAMRTESATHNENVLIGFVPLLRPEDKVGVRLIAGLIARRIIPWVTAGDVVPRSERISLIQFGSRVDLYLPLHVQIKVQEGDKVVGGQTIVATFEPAKPGDAKAAEAKPAEAKPGDGKPAIRVPLPEAAAKPPGAA